MLVAAASLACGWGAIASAQVTVSPTSLTWAKVALGQTGGQKVVTLSNAGSSAITISSIGVTGTNASDFAVFSKTCGSTLAASASCTANIIFRPTTTGTRTATLMFTDSDPSSPQEVSLSGLATGNVTSAPSSLSFGNVTEGSTSSSQTITVTNSTGSSVTLTAPSITGTNAADFAVSSTTCTSTLATSTSCSASITFTPSTTAAETATFSITDSASTTALTTSLSGTGAAQPAVSASPATLAFGSVIEGSSSGSQTITISNPTSSSVTLSSGSISGTNAGDFSISSTTCTSTLAASANCTASIAFTPSVSGSETADWMITSSDSTTPLSVSLTGTGAGQPAVSASPATLAFGSVNEGSSSGAQTITVSNPTSNSVTLGSASISGTNAGDFSVSSTTCTSTLAAAASCTASIVFTPSASGSETADWTITSSDSTTPLSVSLTGTGAVVTAPPTTAASPASLTWGSVAVGSAGGSKTVTLANSGSSAITIISIALTGTNAADFSISQNGCGSALAASSSCTVTIVFTPTATGTRTATLAFTDSDPSSPQQVSVSGTGAGSVTAAPSSLSFGSVNIGSSSASQTITVSNTTSSSVTLNTASITGANASDFTVTYTTCSTSLAASTACTASIAFTPTLVASETATWSITSSNSATPLNVALSGSGANSSSGSTTTASPSSLTWGSVAFGNTGGAKTATLTNSGSSAISFSSITITGADPNDFFFSASTCGTSVPASSSCTASVYFKPTATGSRTAILNFNDGASGSPQIIALAGTGTASTSGSVTTSPATLSFGSVDIGSTISAMSATLSNATASSITISGTSITGTNSGDFAIVSTTCGSSLAASASCSVSVAFTPSAAGTRGATLSFSDTASNSPQGVSLTGSGFSTSAGAATVNPTSVSFGSFVVGSTSSTKNVTLKNTGSSTFSMSGFSITGANPGDFFETTQSCGTGLAPSASCTISLIFQPTATGARTATLNIADGASNSPQTVALSGTGAPAPSTTLAISPSGQAWGAQTVGTAASAQTFTLTGGGSGSLSFNSFGFTGTDPGDFSITNNTCGSTLAAGASCAVTVAFKPSAIGNRVALFSVTDTGIASPQTAEVSGAGAYSAAQTPSVTVDFGSRSGSQVAIPAGILGTEYLESLPTNANRTTVVQGGFTAARYRLEVQTIFPSSATAPSWGALNSDMQKLAAAGVHPIMEVEDTPTFLQPSPLRCVTSAETSVPTDFNAWGQLAAQIVNHLDTTFPGLAQYYEIWNEPNTAALCSGNQLSDYLSIYAAAAPLMKAQAQADGTTIYTGGPATAGVAFTTLLTNSSTGPYVDFYSYHLYVGSSTSIKDGMTWNGAGGTPSLLGMVTNSSSGLQAKFIQAYKAVAASTLPPLGAKTPIFYDEYNDDWAFTNDCCRNSLTYSPLFNSVAVAQVLNSVYHGAATVPSRMIYFAAAQTTFCILAVPDNAMDCSKAATGAQALPYPQWYTYELLFAPSYLDLQDGGHMASSVTLSSGASSQGLIATAYYSATTDSVLIINPTASSFSGVTLQINNSGLSSPASTLYTINATNPTVSTWPATTITASGGTQATFDLPPYSVLAISLKN